MSSIPTFAPSEYPYLPRRIASARIKCSLSQAALADQLGFNDRQTLAAIESGERRVNADELLVIAEKTGRKIEFFTDPFLIEGEGQFSYRASGTPVELLDAFEAKAGRWLALWRRLGELRGESPSPLRRRLDIHAQSTFEEAQAASEAVGRELQLGEVPAEKLAGALEEKFQLLVLYVDMPTGVSGAAAQLARGDTILINRHEPSGRQAFDLAHELFHVLTWDALPPKRVDLADPAAYTQKRTEQLANNFASALLMPIPELKPRWEKSRAHGSLEETLQRLAGHFRVSPLAVGWRAVALGWIKADEMRKVAAPAQDTGKDVGDPLFSRRFVERLTWGIERGEVSVRRLLGLLGLNLDEFRACCQAFGVNLNIGM